MKRIKKTLIFPLSTLVIITIFAMATNAQTASSNHFLKVVDYKNNPVADAEVIMSERSSNSKKTNAKGELKRGMFISYGDYNTLSFSISKEGYYTFIDDLGIIKILREDISKRKDKVIIELFLIPTNEKERKAIGNEQSKREFFSAARKGKTKTVKKFLKTGLSPNLTTSQLRGIPILNETPIIVYAARSGNAKTINALLSAGAKINNRNEVARNILAVYIQSYPYHYQLNDPNSYPDFHENMLAFEKGAENLIKAGANKNGKIKYEKANAMIIAARNGYEEIVKLLHKKGASVNSTDENGKTVLMHVIDRSFEQNSQKIKMAELLIGLGADINSTYRDTNSYGGCISPLKIATQEIDIETIKFLLINQANVNITCKGSDETILSYVKNSPRFYRAEDKEKIIKLLKSAGAK